ncbi:hypothetical protein [Dictyobacter arantiisoli]|uniref:TPM domain-containing protein n=1 Tax=Dictyobacter arantiisoli TaxID=2014874 RepID=A0A5A5TIR6_9CHLR|nr:hypothetical protein [Dictyobacter arantiisoli]GCF11501.1 hypothetical protein KDI_50650 [Dictyobacter arantiisoli]
MGMHFPGKSAYCRVLLTLSGLLLLLCAISTINIQSVSANSVLLRDQAGVLDQGKVQTEGAKLSEPLGIYTTRTFGGDQSALNADASSKVGDAYTIVIEIDVAHRHLSIESGQQSNISNDQASNALDAFRQNIHGSDYTGATLAAIDALNGTAHNGGGLEVVGVVIVIIIMAIIISRTRRRGDGRGRGRGRGFYSRPYMYGGGGDFGGGGGGGGGGGAGGSF